MEALIWVYSISIPLCFLGILILKLSGQPAGKVRWWSWVYAILASPIAVVTTIYFAGQELFKRLVKNPSIKPYSSDDVVDDLLRDMSKHTEEIKHKVRRINKGNK